MRFARTVFSFFVFIFSLFYFSLNLYAADPVVLSPYAGFYFNSNTSLYVYASSDANINRYRIVPVTGRQLNSASSITFYASADYGLYGISLRSSSVLIPFSALEHKSSAYYFDVSDYGLSVPLPFNVPNTRYTEYTLDLSNYTFDDDLYYYILSSGGSATAYLDSVRLTPTLKPTATPTLKPTATPTVRPVSTPTPTLKPTSVPTFKPTPTPMVRPTSAPPFDSDTLDHYSFWAAVNDIIINAGILSQRSASGTAMRFVPSSMANFSDDNVVHNYVYTVPVRIPFRISSDFTGIGLLDANFSFDWDYGIFGVDGYGLSGSGGIVSPLVDFSDAWLDSGDGFSFDAFLQSGGASFNVYNVPVQNGTTGQFYFCFDMYISLTAGSQVSGLADYVDIMIDDLQFNLISSTKISDSNSSDSILEDIRDEQQKQDQIENDRYQEEQDKINEAEGSITDGAGQLTDLLSSWEIFTMPFKIVQDLVGALSGDGSTGLTFPSISIMGQQLWPSYTFDLKTIADKFPVLYNSLHLITGIMVVSWFLHYCWRKWHILIGDDMPES